MRKLATAALTALAITGSSASPSSTQRLAATEEWTKEEKAAGFKTSEFTRFVPSGVERMLSFFYASKLDCSSQGLIVVKTIQKPNHGTIETEQGEGFPMFTPDSKYYKCNDQKTSGVLIKYKSSNDYVGADSFKILILLPGGFAREALYKMIVK